MENQMFRKRSMSELNRISEEAFSQETKSPFVFVLDSIRSLNNVGSVFRTADSFNAAHICLCGVTGTPPHRDINKTALGATETVAWSQFPSIENCLKYLKSEGFFLYAIEQTHGSIELHQIHFESDKKYAFILGNEVSGVSDEALQLVDGVIEIPQFGTKHSLNVSVTAGIIAWHYVNQMLVESR